MATNLLNPTPQDEVEPPPPASLDRVPRLPPELLEAGITPTEIETVTFTAYSCIRALRRALGRYEDDEWSTLAQSSRNAWRAATGHGWLATGQGGSLLGLTGKERRLFDAIVLHLDPRSPLA
jgi:hypothetical protein